ncbi:ferritin-like metal-binding protein YciE [Deinobacterium chartae]|uniref:Ferritin-like metal-binding protein YciE n=1 Tax=Deinobacterium chartae TaxID=521158 RepID=A0A841I4N7_9DEIO|nr:ferritin-like metal-binding protein YciE [Deinobacterium chartae]
MTDLRDLYLEQLRDLYSAEKQILEALPQMAQRASDQQLKQGFEMHAEQTRQQMERLNQIFQKLGESPDGKTCKAMQGLIAEGQEMLREDATPEVMDAGLIAAAQRVEHYEIAGYGTVRTYAQLLGDQEAVQLLEQTLQEEGMTDQKLTQIASSINVEAMQS